VNKWKVALRLHPEFKTEPNVFYIPPFSPPVYSPAGELTEVARIPVEVLAKLFGDTADQSIDQRIERIREIFRIILTEREKVAKGGSSELIDILIPHSEMDRIRV
jgi:nitrate reductase beta subunit